MPKQRHPVTVPIFAQGVTFAGVLALTIIGSARASSRLTAVFPTDGTAATVWYFFAVFTMTTFVIVLLLRTFRSRILFGAVFALAVFSGVGTLSALLFGDAVAVLLTSAAALSYYSANSVLVHDMVLAIGLAGVAVMVGGGMVPVAVVVILAILAVYDIIAVYGTGHMVTMGKDLVRLGARFVFIFPSRAKGFLLPLSAEGKRSGDVVLGTGDIVLPALLVASVARYDIMLSLYPAVGAFFGLWVSMRLFLGDTRHRPMPALPPVALGAILGYVVTFLL